MAARFDIFDQAVLTDVINRPFQTMREDQAFLGEQIAPMKTIQSRSAKLQVNDIVAFGLGQFKAPDATPPLWSPIVSWKEQIIELALLEEMHRISGEDWLRLHSTDDVISRVAGMDLVERGRALQLRNERLTEWMRWQAFKGNLTIKYPTGDQLYINYGMLPTHLPTAATLWSDVVNADPVSDIQAWSTLIAADSGYYGTKLHMTSLCWDYLIRNQKIKNSVNFYAGGANIINRPRRAEILELFTSFAASVDVVIYDNGYRAEGVVGQGWPGSITKYLPDDHVLMTTEYVVDLGEIADTLDGQVLINSGYNSVSINQGMQSEVILDPMSKNHFLRQASARIPRIKLPECFLYARIA